MSYSSLDETEIFQDGKCGSVQVQSVHVKPWDSAVQQFLAHGGAELDPQLFDSIIIVFGSLQLVCDLLGHLQSNAGGKKGLSVIPGEAQWGESDTRKSPRTCGVGRQNSLGLKTAHNPVKSAWILKNVVPTT